MSWLYWNNGRGWPPQPGKVAWLYNEKLDHLFMLDEHGNTWHDGPHPHKPETI